MLFALLAICIFFHIVTNGIFLSPENITVLVRQSSIVGVLAIGMVLVIVSGNIDLSVGSLVGLTGGMAAIFSVNDGMSLPFAIFLTMIFGIAIGAAQGFLVAYMRVPAFIVTLGGLLIFRGAISAWMQGKTIPVSIDFNFIGGGFLNTTSGIIAGTLAVIYSTWFNISKLRAKKLHGIETKSSLFSWVNILGTFVLISFFLFVFHANETENLKAPISGMINLPSSSPLFHESITHPSNQIINQSHDSRSIPVPVIIMILLALIFTFISNKTIFGRRIFAIGGNAETAFLSGINVKRNTLFVFALMGLMSAIAGIIYTARVGSAAPDAAKGYELYAIAACVIGGTSLSGGKGTIFGAIIGALIMSSLDSGMSIMNVDSFYQDIIKGAVLIAAVYLDVAGRKNK